MSPQIKFSSVLVTIALFVSAFVLYQNKDALLQNAKSLLHLEGKDSVIATIKKEISTPGALFARIESSKAFLTHSGVFNLTNTERRSHQLAIFNANKNLDLIASARLQDMFAKGYFEHVSPTGESASSVANTYGYEYIMIGENIALGNFENDQALVTAWMNSPGHRANILNEKFTELGVAVGKGTYHGKSTWIGVQIFARPLSLCAKIDETLKQKIDSENHEISQTQSVLSQLQAELDSMARNGSYNRSLYNQKVDSYNSLAKTVNTSISALKADIATYNNQVRIFNLCTGAQ